MKDKEKLLEHMEDLGNCVSDLQIDSLILSLLEFSPPKSEYEKSVVIKARGRTVNFISNYVQALTCAYRNIDKLLDLKKDRGVIEVSQLLQVTCQESKPDFVESI